MKKILRSTIGKSLLACSFFSVTLFSSSDVMAQSGVGINGTGAPANSSAGLDVDFSNKGVLIPRIALTSTTDVTTIPTPANSLLVFNTTNGAGLTPGFYYYDGNLMQWTAVAGSGGGGGGGGTTINCSSPSDEMTAFYNASTGSWECNDVLEIDPTWNAVSINAFSGPSSSYNLLVEGNVGIDGIGSTSTSFDLSVGGDAHIDNGLSVGTTTSSPTNGILSAGDVKLNSSTSSFVVGSTNITGSGSSVITGGGLSVGTTSSPPSNGLRVSGQITTNATSGFTGYSTSNTTGTAVVLSSGTLRTTSSSLRYKENIKDLPFEKSKVLSIRPVTFNYKESGAFNVGVIAEEVEQLIPELVIYDKTPVYDANGEKARDEFGNLLFTDVYRPESVNYDGIAVSLIPIVREHEEVIQAQQAEINELKAALAAQQAEMAKLMELVSKISAEK